MSMKPLGLAGVLLACAVGASAAPAARTLDAYVLVASDLLRARTLHVTGGDLATVAGPIRSSGGLDAPGVQLVAPSVRLDGASSCGAVLSDDAAGTSPTCVAGGGGVANLFGDLGAECGMPAPMAPCDAGQPRLRIVGATRTLPAGTYGDVRLATAGTIVDLPGGVYTFCSLRAVRGAQIRVHGPTEIRIAGDLLLGGSLGPAPGVAVSSTDVRVFVRGRTVRASRGASLSLRLCAPQATARLSRSTLQGQVVAARVKAVRSTVMAPYAERREPCAARNRLRNVYFGDLHVHTQLSFDAYAFDVRTTPAQAYQFAQGAAVQLPPLDVEGHGTQTLQLDRPLDFTAITDHSEFLGEVRLCTTPGSPVYDSALCQNYRVGGNSGTTYMALPSAFNNPMRHPDVCGADGQGCYPTTQLVWDEIQQAAEDAYDRSAACTFTSLVGYEYTASASVSTLHRNVIFRNDHVPLPTTVFEASTREDLWNELESTCRDAGMGCDVLAIPHNSNESNGKMFAPDTAGNLQGQRTRSAFRASMEPLAEIYQHKGDSECSNGLSGIVGAADEQCGFEKRRRDAFADCGDGTGATGTITGGCVSRRDFLRGAWLEGMKEVERIGADPFHLGVIASTDSHNGTPGAVREASFIGHRGTDDGTVASRLGEGDFYPGGYRYSPGGLAAVWAEENSRASLFDALRRRETYGTSGPRIAVRLFGGWNLGAGLCSDPQMIEQAYAAAVPMGGMLATPPAGATAPSFLVNALKDPGTVDHPGSSLQVVQIIKLWRAAGESHQQVYDVAGDPNDGATVDDATCAQSGPGFDSLCTVWTDPDFDPTQQALYYVRVIENPSCRWSAYQCNALAPADRPPSCTDPNVPRTVQERAWTSPIWFTPAG